MRRECFLIQLLALVLMCGCATIIVKPLTPLGREQTAEDIGRAVVFFVSEDAKNITWQVLHVDGGMIMR